MESFILNCLIIGGLMMFAIYKIFGTIDDDGQIKKTAKDGVIAWLRKKFPEQK